MGRKLTIEPATKAASRILTWVRARPPGTLAALAADCGVSTRQLSRYLTGECDPPTLVSLALEQATGTRVKLWSEAV